MKNIISLLFASFLLYSCVEVEEPLQEQEDLNSSFKLDTAYLNSMARDLAKNQPKAINNNCGGEIILGIQVRNIGTSTYFDYSPGTWIHLTIATKDNCGTLRRHKVIYPQSGSNSFVEQKLPESYLPGKEWTGYVRGNKNYKSKLREINKYPLFKTAIFDTLQSYSRKGITDDIIVLENEKAEVDHILIMKHISREEFIKGLGYDSNGSKQRGFDRGNSFEFNVNITIKILNQNSGRHSYFLGDFFGPNKLPNTRTYLDNSIIRTLGNMPK
jgi:hypothetical protein